MRTIYADILHLPCVISLTSCTKAVFNLAMSPVFGSAMLFPQPVDDDRAPPKVIADQH